MGTCTALIIKPRYNYTLMDQLPSIMKYYCKKHYNEDFVSPAFLIFGDNLQREGYGGQAIIRRYGTPGIIPFGIATKKSPYEYFSDGDFDDFKKDLDSLARLKHTLSHHFILWPQTHIGNGLADLPNKAPLLWEYLNQFLKTEYNLHYNDHLNKVQK